MMNRKKLLIPVHAAVAVIILYLLCRDLELSRIMQAIAQADGRLLTFAVLASFAMTAIAAPLFWKFLLRLFGCSIGFKESLFIKLAITPLKGIIPLKAAEALRCAYLKKRYNLPISQCLKMLLINFALSLLVLCSLCAIGLVANGRSSVLLQPAVLWALISIAAAVFLFYRFSLKSTGRLAGMVLKISAAKDFLRKTRLLLKLRILLASSSIEFLEIVALFLISRSIGIDIPFKMIFFVTPLVIIITNLPITIFGLGIREAAMLFLLKGAAPAEIILSCSLLYSLICYLLPALAGLSCTTLFLSKITDKAEKSEGNI